MTTAAPASTPLQPHILTRAGDLLARYEVILCDVWGVVHDGFTAYPQACEALARFRRQGGTVVLVSNAPVPNDRVAQMLGEKKVPRDAYDAIVSSGDIALAHLAERRYRFVHTIGPSERDAALFARLSAEPVSLERAEAIVCSGLNDDINETAESYRPTLERALRRELPFVCANPDLVVDVGGRLYLCAGAIAQAYAELGGAVFWAGKPHAAAYGSALALAERLRDAPVSRAKVLGIGDAVRTDLAAAAGAGVDALFIAAGIHRHETMRGEEVCPHLLGRLLTDESPPAVAAMAKLAW